MKAVTLLTAASVVGVVTLPAVADVLWENGAPNGVGGYSNATSGVFGFRRSLLDDFLIVDDGTRAQWNSVWGTPMGGAMGTGAEISFRSDLAGTPGEMIAVATVTAYSESFTGNIFFSREEVTHWATFDDVVLDAGKYWWEATVVGPENNFWLTADQRLDECWVNYEDLGGFVSGTDQFGVASDLNFILSGTIPVCSADLDDDGEVGFTDLLVVLAAWGICDHPADCPEDLDGDGVVGIADLLILLGQWGPCPPRPAGACCLEGQCIHVDEDVCTAMGGTFAGEGTICPEACRNGACCLDDGEPCVEIPPGTCEAMRGSFRGVGTTCVNSCDLSTDDCADAIVVGEGAYMYSNIGATTDGPGLPQICNEGGGLGFERDVWFRYQAACDGTATASVCDSNFNTRMAIYDDGDPPNCPGPLAGCSDDACGVADTRSELSFDVEVGGVYLVRIGSRTGSIGFGMLVLECEP